MAYTIDAETIRMEEFGKRIQATDLVPSREPLRVGLVENLRILSGQGLDTLAQLRQALKNPRRLAELAAATGIDAGYLTLLRREIEGYFPRPFELEEFAGLLTAGDVERLGEQGVHTAADLYRAACEGPGLSALGSAAGIDREVLFELFQRVDLTRIQWVNPNTAQMLVEAGYASVSAVAAADPADLDAGLARANQDGRYFKGKIGLRDVKRLIQSAGTLNIDPLLP